MALAPEKKNIKESNEVTFIGIFKESNEVTLIGIFFVVSIG